MAGVEVANLSRAYGAVRALDDVSIGFQDGGFYGLLGPSGSGKTTLLRMIAGFDFPDSGSIRVGGTNVERTPVERREIGMVFQNYALFPNMSVFENVAFGLSVRSVARAETEKRVREALALVQLDTHGERRPHQLSGGQRQRVALARAIVTRPRVLLLDEPLSALDKALRVDMQIELRRIQREVGITTIFVTHDQEEALTMSDRVGILRDGRLVQEGPPDVLYDRPATVFAATFLGDANILRGAREGDRLRLPEGSLVAPECADSFAEAWTACAVRPERITITSGGEGAAGGVNSLPGVVAKRIFAGSSITYLVDWQGQTLKVSAQNTGAPPVEVGTEVVLTWSPQSATPVAEN
jgi:putative spermidine/putrescine transport system ATP-binding protein